MFFFGQGHEQGKGTIGFGARMEIVRKKVQSQVQFWSLLGPFLVLLSIAVLLFKVSVHWYFPVSVLVGIPLCVKWKMKGLAAALSCLFILSAIGYQHLDLEDRYWHVGLALTMAFSFIVLTLSLEEAQGLIDKLQLESQSRLDNFVLLDEKWKTAEHEWMKENEQSKTEVSVLNREISAALEEKQTFFKLSQLAKDELILVKGQHEQLLQDFLYKKQQISQLQERFEESELTVQKFVNSDVEKKMKSFQETLSKREQETESLKAKLLSEQSVLQKRHDEELSKVVTQIGAKNSALDEAQAKLEKLHNELQQQKALVHQTSQHLHHAESVKGQLEQVLRKNQEQLQQLRSLAQQKESIKQTKESPSVETNSSRNIDAMYTQLKEQFEEKCRILDSTRRELFHANEELCKWKKERDEEQIYGQSVNEINFQRNFMYVARQHERMQLLYQQELDGLSELIGELLHQMH